MGDKIKIKCINGEEENGEKYYILDLNSEGVDIEEEKYYPTLEALVTNMYDKFYQDLTSNNQRPYSNKGDEKKEIILLFEQVVKSLRYLIINDQNQVYKDFADPLELLNQLCDMNNIVDLCNKLICKYASYYENDNGKCMIKIKSFRKDV